MYKVKKVNSITYQRFHCLTLDVQNRGTASGSGGADSRRPSLSLAHCLDAYFREEVSEPTSSIEFERRLLRFKYSC